MLLSFQVKLINFDGTSKSSAVILHFFKFRKVVYHNIFNSQSEVAGAYGH